MQLKAFVYGSLGLALTGCATGGVTSYLDIRGLGPRAESARSPASESPKPIRETVEPAAPKDSDKYDKVAVVAWNPSGAAPVGASARDVGRYLQSNREAIADLVREAAAKGAKLVVTPEFAVVGYPDFPELPPEDDNFRNPKEIAPFAEPVPGPSTEFFGKLARELGIYLHVGFAEADKGKYYNVAAVLGPDGRLIGKFRKINLYQKENDFLVPGDELLTYDSPWGKIGIIICADVYMNDPMERYKRAGVDVLALSTSWAQMNTGMDYFRKGAKWVNAYLLAANQTYFPDSGVINPDGSNQSHIRQSSGVAYGYLPKKAGGGSGTRRGR
jgi:predicted amidohydrolase